MAKKYISDVIKFGDVYGGKLLKEVFVYFTSTLKPDYTDNVKDLSEHLFGVDTVSDPSLLGKLSEGGQLQVQEILEEMDKKGLGYLRIL